MLFILISIYYQNKIHDILYIIQDQSRQLTNLNIIYPQE